MKRPLFILFFVFILCASLGYAGNITYQETPDEIGQSGNWSATHNYTLGYDGNWSTYAESIGGSTNAYLWFNYTIPDGYNPSNVIVQTKIDSIGIGTTVLNNTLPLNCTNHSSGKIILKVSLFDTGTDVGLQCIQYDEALKLIYYFNAQPALYEEAIYFDVPYKTYEFIPLIPPNETYFKPIGNGVFLNETYANDTNYTTYASLENITGTTNYTEYYFNYTHEYLRIDEYNFLTIKDNCNTTNLTVPTSCVLNVSTDGKFVGLINGTDNYTVTSCYNSTGWVTLDTCTTNITPLKIYETEFYAGFDYVFINENVSLTTGSNASYISPIGGINCSELTLDDKCLNITDGLYDGEYCFILSQPTNLTHNVNITVHDAETSELITGSNISLQIYDTPSNFTRNNRTNNGYLYDWLPIGSTVRILASHAFYDTVVYFYDITPSTRNIQLFLTNDTSTNRLEVSLNVRDVAGLPIEDANIKVYAQNAITGEFEKTIDRYTNPNGEYVASLVINNVYYKFIVYSGDKVCYETARPFTIFSTTTSIYFTCVLTGDYITLRDEYDNAVGTITYTNTSNVTGYFTMNAETINGSNVEFCFEVRQLTRTGQGYIINSTTCQNTSSFLTTVYLNVTDYTNDVSFEGVGKYRPIGLTLFKVLGSRIKKFVIESVPDFGNIGLLLTFIVMGTMFFLFIKEPKIAIVSAGSTFFIATMTPFVNLSDFAQDDVGAGIIVLIISIIIAFIIEKKNVQ